MTDYITIKFKNDTEEDVELNIRNVGNENPKAEIQIEGKVREVRRLKRFSLNIPSDKVDAFLRACQRPDGVNLLQTYNAYQNCIKSNNTEWQNKHLETIEKSLLDALPHGSGIDYKWEIYVQTPDVIEAHNAWHLMNDGGMYCGHIDFSVLINCKHRDMFGKIIFRIVGRFGKHQDIKDYLYEIITDALENL